MQPDPLDRHMEESRSSTSATEFDVDIGVIYTYEDDYMDQLIPSLAASGDSTNPRLLLVDNASEGGTQKWAECFRHTMVLKNKERLGYGSNLNRILSAASGRYILLLNTDMYFEPSEQMLTKMVRFMDQHPDCGVSGCRLYHEDQSYAFPARRFLTIPAIAARRMSIASRIFGRDVDDLLYREKDNEASFECDWLSGCFLFVRREAWEQMGGFDEGFQKYFEDVDFCARIRAAGWSVMFNGATYGYHIEQRDSRRIISRDGWLMARSYVRWLLKWGLDPNRRIDELQRNEPHAA